MNTIRPRAVDDYVRRLERSLRGISRSRRQEIVSEIEEHINEALAGSHERPSEAEVRNVLERLGEPEEIAADAAERLGITPFRPPVRDVAAIVLLLAGGVLFPAIGWFIGVALLWTSGTFTTRDKLIGTFVLPGGLALPAILILMPVTSASCVVEGRSGGVTVSTCASEPLLGGAAALILFAVALLAPIGTAIYLSRRLSRSRPSDASGVR